MKQFLSGREMTTLVALTAAERAELRGELERERTRHIAALGQRITQSALEGERCCD